MQSQHRTFWKLNLSKEKHSRVYPKRRFLSSWVTKPHFRKAPLRSIGNQLYKQGFRFVQPTENSEPKEIRKVNGKIEFFDTDEPKFNAKKIKSLNEYRESLPSAQSEGSIDLNYDPYHSETMSDSEEEGPNSTANLIKSGKIVYRRPRMPPGTYMDKGRIKRYPAYARTRFNGLPIPALQMRPPPRAASLKAMERIQRRYASQAQL
jgi:hypothetical protein